jgi:hypothetical protein
VAGNRQSGESCPLRIKAPSRRSPWTACSLLPLSSASLLAGRGFTILGNVPSNLHQHHSPAAGYGWKAAAGCTQSKASGAKNLRPSPSFVFELFSPLFHTKKRPIGRFLKISFVRFRMEKSESLFPKAGAGRRALAGLELRVRLADHVNRALTLHHLAISVTTFCGSEG